MGRFRITSLRTQMPSPTNVVNEGVYDAFDPGASRASPRGSNREANVSLRDAARQRKKLAEWCLSPGTPPQNGGSGS